ncbi:zinc ribbon domain-containing protein [Flavobacterium sp. XS2P12]|uniref:zinc ribbon domain-containing protein n=1 Tax=Flavobacterium melibiosi TaxID=3398734 RepID=UPI003A8C1E4A
MENIIFCQSCGMPLDSEAAKGTEQNGLKNNEYCKYCYEDGTFKKPEMKLEDMKNTVETQMKKLNLPVYTIQRAINILPVLKRWKNS